jgi:hypothetical protein
MTALLAMRSVLLAAASLLLACKRAPADVAVSESSSMEQFRRELADPKLYPVRRGKTIDETAMRVTMKEAVAAHREELARLTAESIAALPNGRLPDAGTHDVRLAFDIAEAFGDSEDPVAREAGEAMWALDEGDVTMTARRLISQSLPLAMVRGGDPHEQVGVWLGFFHAARPVVAHCGRTNDAVTICVDYGGRDVLVVELAQRDGALLGRRLQWFQRRE